MTPHPADEQLIAHLYGVGPDDGHVDSCTECQARLLKMRLHREGVEQNSIWSGTSSDFLAAQRRKIYEKISQPVFWWSHLGLRRWAPAAAGLLVLAGGLLLFEEHRAPSVPDNISDAQLAQDVSRMAEDAEPPATAPLQALFEE
jgi:hypothetical protein